MKRGEVTPLEHLERRRRRLVEEVEEEASRFSEHIQTEKNIQESFCAVTYFQGNPINNSQYENPLVIPQISYVRV